MPSVPPPDTASNYRLIFTKNQIAAVDARLLIVFKSVIASVNGRATGETSY